MASIRIRGLKAGGSNEDVVLHTRSTTRISAVDDVGVCLVVGELPSI